MTLDRGDKDCGQGSFLFLNVSASLISENTSVPRVTRASRCFIIQQLLGVNARYASGNVDTAGRGMGEGMGDTASVSDDVETVMLGTEMLIDLYLHIVELDLNTV